MPALPDSTQLDQLEEVIVAGDYEVLFYTEASKLAPRFRHVCNRQPSRRGTVICAPMLLPGAHTIVSRHPLTITPRIHCPDCDTHGWITDGLWVPT